MKKFICFLLTFLLLFSLTACKSNNDDNNNEDNDDKCTSHTYGAWEKDDKNPCLGIEHRYCIYCNASDMRIVDFPHTPDSKGVCIDCKEKVYFSQEEMKSLIQITYFDVGEYNGEALSEIRIVCKNTSNKVIKEIIFVVKAYYSDESDTYSCTLKNIHLSPERWLDWWWEPLWPTGMFGEKITAIKITYTDGTSLRISGESVSFAFWKDSDNSQTNTENDNDNLQISNVSVGDTLTLGHYEQDNNSGNEAESITWKVLKVEKDKALLISEYCLDNTNYHNVWNETAWTEWANCSLRTWLNTTFYDLAFSNSEKKIIKNNLTESNANDKVFILNISEAMSLFNSNSDRQARSTKYLKSKNYWFASEDAGGYAAWWLRNAGELFSGTSTAAVDGDGSIWDYGYTPSADDVAVRPAMWISIG